MARKREWDDDDGRTIASMSDLELPNLIIPRRRKPSSKPSQTVPEETDDSDNRQHSYKVQFSRQERGWYVAGALRAALLIGLAFIVGLGLVILLMLLVWG